MNDDNEERGRNEETVPYYQIQLENLDFKLKQLKGDLFILEQKYTQDKIRINSKIESAKRALEKPLKDLEKVQNKVNSYTGEEIRKNNEEINSKKQKSIENINKLEENLYSKYNEENEKYEKMLMLENDILSTEIEKKRMEEEIKNLDKKMESINKTYPESFKKLREDFNLFDKKSRIEVNIKEIEDKINLQNLKVEEYKNIGAQFENTTAERNSGNIELRLKLNEEKQNEIDKLVSSITQNVNRNFMIEKFFPMFDSYFDKKNYIENKITVKTVKEIIIPFVKDILNRYNEINNDQLDIISQSEKEISDLSDMKPVTMKIKREIKLKQNKLKENNNFTKNYLSF